MQDTRQNLVFNIGDYYLVIKLGRKTHKPKLIFFLKNHRYALLFLSVKKCKNQSHLGLQGQ